MLVKETIRSPRKFENYFLLTVVALPVIANFFSRNLAEYFFDIAIIVALYLTVKNKNGWNFRNLFIKSGFNFLWILFFVVFCLSYVVNGTLGKPQLSEFVLFIWFLGMFLYAKLLSNIVYPTWSIKAFCGFIVLISIGLIFQFFYFPDDSQNIWNLTNRLRGTFTNTNFLTHSYALVFIFIIGLFVGHLKTSSIDRYILLGTLTLLGLTLLLTFNRTIWISTVVIVPMALFGFKRKYGIVSLIVLLSMAAIMYFGDIGTTRYRVYATLNPSQSGDVTRLNLWKANFQIFKENPLLGIGYYNNTRDIQKYYDKLNLTEGTIESHAHNQVLSFLAGTGVAGTSIFISIFVCFFVLSRAILKTIPKENVRLRGIILGCLLIQPAFLINGIADNNFEIHVARNMLIVSWAIILATASKQNVTLCIPTNILGQKNKK